MSQPTSSEAVKNKHSVWVAAKQYRVDQANICVVCLKPIETMCFKLTGVCGEKHRKVRDNEPDRPQAIAGI